MGERALSWLYDSRPPRHFTPNEVGLRARFRAWRRSRKYHRELRRFLRLLSHQRVSAASAAKIGTGAITQIENAVQIDLEGYYLLMDCVARGWVEQKLPLEPPIQGTICVWTSPSRPSHVLTKLGWDILNRSYLIPWLAFAVALVSMTVSVMALATRLIPQPVPELHVTFPAPRPPMLLTK